MASTIPIDISSSDSEFDYYDLHDKSPVEESVPTRVLPSSFTTGTTSRNTGYGEQTQRNSSKRSNGSNGSPLILNNHFHSQSGYSGNIRGSDQFQTHDIRDFPGKRNVGQPQAVNSRISNVSGIEYEKLSSPEALRRTLPSSLQPSGPSNKFSDSVEILNGSHARDISGNTHRFSGPGFTNTRGYVRDQHSMGHSDEIMMYENRILPPSVMYGKPMSTSQFPSPSDLAFHSILGEERVGGHDERLIYQAALEDLNQPKTEATPPDGLLSVPLLRHQKIALAWMLQKETRSLHCLGGILADDQGLGKTISMIALIQVQKSLQSKSKSEDQSNPKTEALNLDDDDDDNSSVTLGKAKETVESGDIKPIPEVSTSTGTFSRRRPAAGTLVVCPASVLRQWARELDDKVGDKAKLSVLIYHGGSRTKDPAQLAKYDVVLTTYAIVTNEVPKQPMVDEDDADEKNGEKCGLSSEFSINKKRKKTSKVSKKRSRKGIDTSYDYDCGALARVGWFRVILDEAQTIKNHRTQVARACCSLRAKRRWCLSGTPIQNAIDDLYSYFRFLRYDPYAAYKSFYNTIKVPISRNSLHGYKKLQAVLRAIMLRRTKGTLIDGEPIVKLPPKLINLKKVDFSKEERVFYTRLEADSRSQFKAYAAAGTVNQNYANILLMLLRLRQACDHPQLVNNQKSDSVAKDSAEMVKRLPRDMVINLLNHLSASSALCCQCNDPPEDPVVTMCGHVFCYQCVSEYVTGEDNTCPVPECKEQLSTDVVFPEATLRSCQSQSGDLNNGPSRSKTNEVVLESEYTSSKIRAVIDILQSICEQNMLQTACNDSMGHETLSGHSSLSTEKPIKAIVFSQWTRMLDLVEYSLNVNCIQYRRLDGTMSLSSRDRAVKDFNTDPEVTVMLMSLKAGNLGLNMVAACHVILLDLWWNPTTEDQAIDRAHRIGQTRPVTVTRLTIKDTVEDRILALQEEKRKMVASAFGEDQSGGSATRLTVEDLKYLFMV
ncbi:Helicase-like transcription factor chr28 [Turnera subulata]|uniref:Helicase-like transcription factor chr28 n=1 Tax=Turnera subulata TaxID=218843 RepID=A0A9Q0FIW3_9ROSI|nr:Helicase-like transcription factor chr28 [Turnera subulata]